MRTLKRTAASDAVVKRLGGSSHPITGQPIFATYRDLLCFCAVLGFDKGLRKPLEGELVDFVDGRIFSNHETSVDLLYLLALAETRDMFVLRDDNEDSTSQIFEEYANGGIQILTDWLKQRPEDIDGDKAILAGLLSGGYFGNEPSSPTEATSGVTF